ncbi:phosphatase PAP2 family protein [Variovorax saccharolyticus]|uniref:phosphatase PAP2 family protein n=1 Tax=Variovorax saccharolyticus TaxID=3053516 RepID=UPI0025774FF3|nr:phosphatase PAP2 family protein [Variovorax sp. J22R187]MDM0018311.1 phosphatase PAP2 family protein [Variovorax sp. J22R187]
MNPPQDLRPAPRPPESWKVEIWLRIRRHFALKVVGTTAFTWLFFIGYFHLLRQPAGPVAVMPLTALDRLIPFQPQALVAYFSLWLYVGFAPGLQLTFRELLVYGLWVGGLCLTGLAFFFLWPTQIPPMAVPPTDFPGFAILQGVDAAGNACPSMHVAIAIFTALWIEHILRHAGAPILLRLANALWFAAIAWSTLAIKQHVVLDVVAGALLGVAFALPSLRWRPRPAANPAGWSGYHEASLPAGRFGGRARRS